jgi:hypothetical protein
VIHDLEFISHLIFILSVRANSSETEKPGMIWCKRQNPCKVIVPEDDDEEEGEEKKENKKIFLLSLYICKTHC